MILEIEGWKFDIDLNATMEYSAREAAEHCDCAYCRNFYASTDTVYPNLRPFLSQFGLDMEAPEELMPFEPTLCLASYRVKGRILSQGSDPVLIDSVRVLPERGEDGAQARCFYLWIGPFFLPWVLNEPAEDVISPANEQSFFDRMNEKLLLDASLGDICS